MIANYISVVALFVTVVVAIVVTFILGIKELRETIFKLRRDVLSLEERADVIREEVIYLLCKDHERKELYEFLKKEYENEQIRINSGNI